MAQRLQIAESLSTGSQKLASTTEARQALGAARIKALLALIRGRTLHGERQR
ncbi:MAG: hypothetical protein ACOVKS_02515 [Aquimonas sp.]